MKEPELSNEGFPCPTCGHAENHSCPLFESGYEPRYNAIAKTKFLAGAYFAVKKLNFPCYATHQEVFP